MNATEARNSKHSAENNEGNRCNNGYRSRNISDDTIESKA